MPLCSGHPIPVLAILSNVVKTAIYSQSSLGRHLADTRLGGSGRAFLTRGTFLNGCFDPAIKQQLPLLLAKTQNTYPHTLWQGN